MKKFVFKIFGYAIVTLVLMYLLDFGYTSIYRSSFSRTKTQYLRTLKSKKIDYIFIGSSRVLSGIVPSVIEERTHKKALNLGFQAARMHDIYTILQLVHYYNIKPEKIFIQVDYAYNFNNTSPIYQTEVLPFIHDNAIFKEHIKFTPSNYNTYYYVPFYRYSKNDLKLGFREVLLNAIGKKTNAINNDGYSPLKGTSAVHKYGLPEKINDNNVYVDSVRIFCKKNKIPVAFYCAPFCGHVINKDFTDKLKKKIPGLYDFSKAIEDEQMFNDPLHMNDSGAKLFTNIFIDKVLENQK